MAGGGIRLAQDFRDLLRAFVAHEVRFLIVGAYALAVLGRPRATGDLDVWIDARPANARRTFAALREFGAPLDGLTVADLASSRRRLPDRFAATPHRCADRHRRVDFRAAWPRRVSADFDGIRVGVIGREDFVTNKRSTGRIKDRADAERLDPRRRRQAKRRR
jgi:hypothetical protein